MAKAAAGSEAKKGGSLVMGVLVPVLVLTVIAAAGGWLIGGQINAAKTVAPTADVKTDRPLDTKAVKELPPIVTNLAAPDGAWVRLQTAIVYDKADDKDMPVLSGQIVDDTMAFMKTLTITQLQGASGLQHLREDLNDRVTLRSNGRVTEMMIEALVIE